MCLLLWGPILLGALGALMGPYRGRLDSQMEAKRQWDNNAPSCSLEQGLGFSRAASGGSRGHLEELKPSWTILEWEANLSELGPHGAIFGGHLKPSGAIMGPSGPNALVGIPRGAQDRPTQPFRAQVSLWGRACVPERQQHGQQRLPWRWPSEALQAAHESEG